MARKGAEKKPIKAVIFDLGNVLVFYDIQIAARRLARACKTSRLRIWSFFVTRHLEKDYTCGRITSRRFYESVRKGLGFPGTYREFKAIWNEIFWPNKPLWRLTKKLSRRYPLYLISNTNSLHWNYLRKTYPGAFRNFRRLFPSHEMACRKPGEEIFKKVLKRIRRHPSETVFVDDAPAFVKGARKAGMHALRYRDIETLKSDLKALGVSVGR